MTTLRTATGKEYYCDFMGTADLTVLYVRVHIDLNEALEVFQNSEETVLLQRIDENGAIDREERNFTIFRELTIMGGFCSVRIRLEKDIDALVNERIQQMADEAAATNEEVVS